MENTVTEMPPVNVNEANTAATNSNQKIVKEGFTLEREDFGRGLGKGFSFWKKQYDSTEDAIKHISLLKKCSFEEADAIVTAMINQQSGNAMRNRATSKLPVVVDVNDDVDKEKSSIARQEAIANGNNILVSQEDAEKYVPGTREKNSLSGLTKDWELAKKAAMEAKAKGDMEALEQYKQEARELYARIQELQAAADAELDNL